MSERVIEDVATRLRRAAPSLTPAERRVAQVVAEDAEFVAFGTVAEIARRAGASGATVVRLARSLDFGGFAELQDVVRGELSDRLRPAAARIREAAPHDIIGRTRETCIEAVDATLRTIDREQFAEAVRLLADPNRAVLVLAGDAGVGIAAHAADELVMLRPNVCFADRGPVDAARRAARLRRGDVVVAFDMRRYDRWVLDVVSAAVRRDASVIAVTDGPLSPLARHAACVVTVEGESSSPFDNYVGALAALSALVAGVAAARRRHATAELDRIEEIWTELDLLSER